MGLLKVETLKHHQECVRDGTEERNGWPPKSPYAVSKAAVNSFSAVLGRETPGLLINACCPGWVLTDMGILAGPKPPKTPGGKTYSRQIILSNR